MNKEENFNQVEKIFKLQTKLAELKKQQLELAKNDERHWELGAEIASCEILLKNLTSICVYCQQNWANFDLENGDLAHYECYQKWWELKSKDINI